MIEIREIVTKIMLTHRTRTSKEFIKTILSFIVRKSGSSSLTKRRLKRRYLQRGRPLKLHLGCGSLHLDDYINIDIQDWANACDLVANATVLHMFEDNSIDHIFTHALLEHIPPWNTMKTLREWYRILKCGGTIQIEVPDLERIFQDWLVNKTLGEQTAIDNIYGGNKAPNKVYSRQDHLAGFTYDRLTRMMRECGFINCKRLEHAKYHCILVIFAQKMNHQL